MIYEQEFNKGLLYWIAKYFLLIDMDILNHQQLVLTFANYW